MSALHVVLKRAINANAPKVSIRREVCLKAPIVSPLAVTSSSERTIEVRSPCPFLCFDLVSNVLQAGGKVASHAWAS